MQLLTHELTEIEGGSLPKVLEQYRLIAKAFAQHYRAAGFAANSTDAGRVQRLYRDFERSQCTAHMYE